MPRRRRRVELLNMDKFEKNMQWRILNLLQNFEDVPL